MSQPTPTTEPFIRQALREGLLFELNSVIENARIPIVHEAFICMEAFDNRINRKDLTDDKNAYTESVRLLEAFCEAVKHAPDNTNMMTFKYDDWVCRVVLHEQELCLVFSEEK